MTKMCSMYVRGRTLCFLLCQECLPTIPVPLRSIVHPPPSLLGGPAPVINSAHSRFMAGIDSPSMRTPSPCPRENNPPQNNTSVVMFSIVVCLVPRVEEHNRVDAQKGPAGIAAPLPLHCTDIHRGLRCRPGTIETSAMEGL